MVYSQFVNSRTMASVGIEPPGGIFLLTVYTRRYPRCPQTDHNYRRCHCPKWITGTLESTGACVRAINRLRGSGF